MTALKDDKMWTCVDPLQHMTAKQTEAAGRIVPGEGGYFTTKNAALAQELKERYPHMLVTEHEAPVGGGKQRGRAFFLMPAMPWKKAVE